MQADNLQQNQTLVVLRVGAVLAGVEAAGRSKKMN